MQDQGQENGVVSIYTTRSLRMLWAAEGFRESGLGIDACFGVKNIGKPDAGKPHVRFDEGRLMNEHVGRHVVAACGEASNKSPDHDREVSFLLYPIMRHLRGKSASYSTLLHAVSLTAVIADIINC